MTNLQHKELADRCEALNTALLQANARIAVQEQALLDAADEQARIRDTSGHAVALEHRNDALVAELRVLRRHLAEANGAVTGRDSAWSHHHSLEDTIQANAEAAESSTAEQVAQLNAVQAELAQSQDQTAKLSVALEDARNQADRWRERLALVEEARNALDARTVAQQTEIEGLKGMMDAMRAHGKVWRKERGQLLREVDKNTASAILRREELHFTRTSLLKETLRLRGELENKPLPGGRAGGSPRRPRSAGVVVDSSDDIADGEEGEIGAFGAVPPTPVERQKILVEHPESPRERRLRTPSARPHAPPPPTFVHGLSPRAPRSLDNEVEFKEQLLFEYRAAARDTDGGAFPPAMHSPSRQRMERLTGDQRVADAVGL